MTKKKSRPTPKQKFAKQTAAFNIIMAKEVVDHIFERYLPNAPESLREGILLAVFTLINSVAMPRRSRSEETEEGDFVVVRRQCTSAKEIDWVADFASRTCAIDYAKILNSQIVPNENTIRLGSYYDVMPTEAFKALVAPVTEDKPS